MNTYEFISAIVSALSWPITVLLLFLLFRTPIVRLLNRIKSMSFRGVDVNLEEEMKELNEETKRLELKVSKQAASDGISKKDTKTLSLTEQVQAIAQISPAAAIQLAWSSVESELAYTVARLAASPDYPPVNSSYENLRLLKSSNYIDVEFEGFLRRLHSLWLKVVHTPENELDLRPLDAIQYAFSAGQAIEHLKGIKRK